MNRSAKNSQRCNPIQLLKSIGFNIIVTILAKNYTHKEISSILKVDRSVITRDVAFLNEQSKETIRSLVHDILPEQFERIYIGLGLIIKESWSLFLQTEDNREKLNFLELARTSYLNRMDLLSIYQNQTSLGLLLPS